MLKINSNYQYLAISIDINKKLDKLTYIDLSNFMEKVDYLVTSLIGLDFIIFRVRDYYKFNKLITKNLCNKIHLMRYNCLDKRDFLGNPEGISNPTLSSVRKINEEEIKNPLFIYKEDDNCFYIKVGSKEFVLTEFNFNIFADFFRVTINQNNLLKGLNDGMFENNRELEKQVYIHLKNFLFKANIDYIMDV